MKIFPPCGFSFNTIFLNLELYWITGRIPLLLDSRILVVCGQCSTDFSPSYLEALYSTFYTVGYRFLIHTCLLILSLISFKALGNLRHRASFPIWGYKKGMQGGVSQTYVRATITRHKGSCGPFPGPSHRPPILRLRGSRSKSSHRPWPKRRQGWGEWIQRWRGRPSGRKGCSILVLFHQLLYPGMNGSPLIFQTFIISSSNPVVVPSDFAVGQSQ